MQNLLWLRRLILQNMFGLKKEKSGEKRAGKNGVLGQGCVLLCLACRKASLWVLSKAARPYELGGSLHLTVHYNTLYGEDSWQC